MLEQHLQTKEENRNQDWDEKFFKLLSESDVTILTEDPQQGPDGWPYLLVETSEASSGRRDSVQKILHWLSTRGIGLVVNPRKAPYPDYVFSFGMIWSFRETGFFIKYQNNALDKSFVIDSKSEIVTGPASAQYLPLYVRGVLKDFFRDQSVFEPKILMISVDGKNYDLCFSLESLGLPPEGEHEGILEAISWFLPPHYSIAIVSESGLPQFEQL
jgi:hypothetical protein